MTLTVFSLILARMAVTLSDDGELGIVQEVLEGFQIHPGAVGARLLKLFIAPSNGLQERFQYLAVIDLFGFCLISFWHNVVFYC